MGGGGVGVAQLFFCLPDGANTPVPPPVSQYVSAAWKIFDDLRRKHVGLPLSMRPNAGKMPPGEELPQPDAAAGPPQTMGQNQKSWATKNEDGTSISLGDWEIKSWPEGWEAFSELTVRRCSRREAYKFRLCGCLLCFLCPQPSPQSTSGDQESRRLPLRSASLPPLLPPLRLGTDGSCGYVLTRR